MKSNPRHVFSGILVASGVAIVSLGFFYYSALAQVTLDTRTTYCDNDGVCETTEYSTCADCATSLIVVESCDNDRICDSGETLASCPNDCPSTMTTVGYCGDQVCSSFETPTSCPKDCLTVTATAYCDNQICDAGETNATCPSDCPLTRSYVCTDSDGGKVAGTLGTATFDQVSLTDVCENDLSVKEAYCISTSAAPASTVMVCGTGYSCRDGACVPASASCNSNGACEIGETSVSCPNDCNYASSTVTYSCTDSDGGRNKDTLGTAKFGDVLRTDSCDGDYVREYYCPSVTSAPAYVALQCDSDYACQNGVCVAAIPAPNVTEDVITYCNNDGRCISPESVTTCPADCPSAVAICNSNGICESFEPTTCGDCYRPTLFCTDTDGGRYEKTAGTVTDSEGVWVDSCATNSTVKERYCLDGKAYAQIMYCGTNEVCSNGACIAAPVSTGTCGDGKCEATVGESATSCPADCAAQVIETPIVKCTDSEADKGLSIAGRVTVGSQTRQDRCQDYKNVMEVFCLNNYFAEEAIACPSGSFCEMGACKRTCGDTICQSAYGETSVSCPSDCPNTIVPPIQPAEKISVDPIMTQEPVVDSMVNLPAPILSPESIKNELPLDVEPIRQPIQVVTNPVAATERLDQKCLSSGIRTVDECSKFMLMSTTTKTPEPTSELPVTCQRQGISDATQCRSFIAYSELPSACREARVTDRISCEAHLRLLATINTCGNEVTDAQGCTDKMVESIRPHLGCESLVGDDCMREVKERNLGEALTVKEKVDRVEEIMRGAVSDDRKLDLANLTVQNPTVANQVKDILPVVANPQDKFMAIRSEKKVVVMDDQTVKNAAAVILTKDSDGDGIPDDVEKRNGLNPTDEETVPGLSDMDFLKSKVEITGIDKAIIDGADIEQPVLAGSVDEKMTVMISKSDSSLPLFGTGHPGETITIFIYSDMPIVMTTTVDENGEWSYEFDGQLTDGMHEAYVAVNDSTGRITRKGNPLAFVVQAAQATTVAEALADTSANSITNQVADLFVTPDVNMSAESVPEINLRRFIVAAALLVALAAALTVALVRSKRQDPHLTP